ncbi:hypothetical protein FQN60_016786 [Etheostoma spectabile]|uniref:DNA/RNA non-specific endonuclease domain-containing protein n=1 Tax=Etheostoma spectabile TaxID=54343 RepID=A0A5J5CBE3_9PERO|nr:hypothetical protein FQN60_016786 [Etheostoma spectabile]
MTSLERGRLLPLAVFFFLSIVPVVAEVVNSVSDCDEFLLRGTPPRVPGILEDGGIVDPERYKPICQIYKNQRRFVTLYDTRNRIPVFSAYNWENMETCTKCILEKYCINSNDAKEAFLVTGAQPSEDNTLKDRVNIPSMLWSAFCCYSKNKKKWLASAHWGDNDNTQPEYLQTKTLAELQETLSTVTSRFETFPETQCPLDTTVAEFYPELDQICQCPPQATTTSAPPTTTTSHHYTDNHKFTNNHSPYYYYYYYKSYHYNNHKEKRFRK